MLIEVIVAGILIAIGAKAHQDREKKRAKVPVTVKK